MARPRTRSRVFAAVLSIAAEDGFASVSMEGIAARAGVSKQTLYRSWASTGEILFDALLSRSLGDDGAVAVPDTGDLAHDLAVLVSGAVAEMTDPTHDRLLRAVTADIQTNEALADQYRDRLLAPQVDAISARFRSGGIGDPDAAVELLLGPVLHRWLLRTGPFDASWVDDHVRRVLLAATTT